MDILRKRKTPNKQIFMITDGKPTCLKEGLRYYKNSFGLDRKVVNKTLNLAAQCRRLKIPVTTFMIATDPYLQAFVEEFTKVNNGQAYYSGLQGLGNLVFRDYGRNRKKSF
jgi:Ca-activated chloride channel homolog